MLLLLCTRIGYENFSARDTLVSSQLDRRLFRSRVHSIETKGQFDRSVGRLFFVLLSTAKLNIFKQIWQIVSSLLTDWTDSWLRSNRQLSIKTTYDWNNLRSNWLAFTFWTITANHCLLQRKCDFFFLSHTNRNSLLTYKLGLLTTRVPYMTPVTS